MLRTAVEGSRRVCCGVVKPNRGLKPTSCVAMANARPSSDMASFRAKLKLANHVVVLTEFENRMKSQNKQVVVITQNIDELHRTAGTENLLELHGSLFKVRCTECRKVEVNKTSPICEALRDKGAPDPKVKSASISTEDLPRCASCGGLLRPHVVWFGEGLDSQVMDAAGNHLDQCDICLVVGTSSVVYPAAMFAPQVAARGVPVAEFNVEDTPATGQFGYHFQGPASETLPLALKE